MKQDVESYNADQNTTDQKICNLLAETISEVLHEAECIKWHEHPVWFLEGNPIVGYSKQKAGIRLMFWSGADFEETALSAKGQKFKDASIFYNDVSEVQLSDLQSWLKKSREIQWDYKNIIKRKGQLERLK